MPSMSSRSTERSATRPSQATDNPRRKRLGGHGYPFRKHSVPEPTPTDSLNSQHYGEMCRKAPNHRHTASRPSPNTKLVTTLAIWASEKTAQRVVFITAWKSTVRCLHMYRLIGTRMYLCVLSSQRGSCVRNHLYRAGGSS
jgi:hypothetical protein